MMSYKKIKELLTGIFTCSPTENTTIASKSQSKPIRIDVGLTGGLTGGVELIDVDAFFQQDKVKRQIEIMRNADIVGKKLVNFKLVPQDEPDKNY